VEIVEVAVVDVALKFPNVGVDVAMMLPEASVERSELIATAERLSVPLKVLVLFQVLAVVVPNANDKVLSAVRSPPPRRGYVVLIRRELVTGVKPKMEEVAATFSAPPVPEV